MQKEETDGRLIPNIETNIPSRRGPENGDYEQKLGHLSGSATEIVKCNKTHSLDRSLFTTLSDGDGSLVFGIATPRNWYDQLFWAHISHAEPPLYWDEARFDDTDGRANCLGRAMELRDEA